MPTIPDTEDPFPFEEFSAIWTDPVSTVHNSRKYNDAN